MFELGSYVACIDEGGQKRQFWNFYSIIIS